VEADEFINTGRLVKWDLAVTADHSGRAGT
jgi:hypothetical protein